MTEHATESVATRSSYDVVLDAIRMRENRDDEQFANLILRALVSAGLTIVRAPLPNLPR